MTSSSVNDTRRRTAGFSIVELLIGMAVLGVLLAVLEAVSQSWKARRGAVLLVITVWRREVPMTMQLDTSEAIDDRGTPFVPCEGRLRHSGRNGVRVRQLPTERH